MPLLTSGRGRKVLKTKKTFRAELLDSVSVSDFSGGLDVVSQDLLLNTRFSKVADNVVFGNDATQKIRPGTELFADTSMYLDKNINLTYFNGFLIVVGKNGQMVRVDASGNVNSIWSDDWANNLPGNPLGWDTTEFVSFAIFNGELIICNGVNKPVIIKANLTVDYLNDPATGSNVNTPIAKYVRTHGRYLVMSGNSTNVDRIFISSTDTSGVFVGDPAPNDAVNVDLGSRVPSGDHTIKGIGRFRDKLMVMFDEAVLPGTLGIFDGADHAPDFDDAIEQHGSISHRAIQTIGEDILFADFIGVPAISRTLFTATLAAARESRLADPLIQEALNKLTTSTTFINKIFSVWDSQLSRYLLFVPNADDERQVTETTCFVFKKNEELKIEAWSRWKGWKWNGAARTELKRVFFINDTQVYLMGNDREPISADFVGDQELWDDGLPWSDGTGWTPIVDKATSGVTIQWTWELPWTAARRRANVKNSRFISFDTDGEDQFTTSMFIDKIYEDKAHVGEAFLEDDLLFDDGLGWDIEVLLPALSMQFVGADSPGYGVDEFGRNYGGGRPAGTELLYAWTEKYKLSKLRFEGDALKPLSFSTITMSFTTGSIRR